MFFLEAPQFAGSQFPHQGLNLDYGSKIKLFLIKILN